MVRMWRLEVGGWRLEVGGWRLVSGKLAAFRIGLSKGRVLSSVKIRSEKLQASPRPTSNLHPPPSSHTAAGLDDRRALLAERARRGIVRGDFQRHERLQGHVEFRPVGSAIDDR